MASPQQYKFGAATGKQTLQTKKPKAPAKKKPIAKLDPRGRRMTQGKPKPAAGRGGGGLGNPLGEGIANVGQYTAQGLMQAIQNNQLPMDSGLFDTKKGRNGWCGGGGGGGGGAAAAAAAAAAQQAQQRAMLEQMYGAQQTDLSNRYNQARAQGMQSSANLLQQLAQSQADQRARDAAINQQLEQSHTGQANTARDDYARLLRESQAGAMVAAPSWLQDQYQQGAGAGNDALLRQQALATRLGQVNDQDFTTRDQNARQFGTAVDANLGQDYQQGVSTLNQDKLKALMALMG